MGVKQGADPQATASQLGLGVLVVAVIAMTYRRLREEHHAGRHKPSKRSAELTRGGTPAHILEHIARIDDPEYICLSVAENKLTVGPLLKKLDQLTNPRSPTSTTTSSVTRNLSGSSIFSTADHMERGRGVGDQQQQPRQAPSTSSLPGRRSSGSSNKLNTLNVTGYDPAFLDSSEEYATTTAPSSATASSVASSSLETAQGGGGGAPVAPLLQSSAAPGAGSASPLSARIASMGYGDTRGPLWVRRAVADMMGKRMFHRDCVDPNNVVIGAGATSVLRLLVVSITEEEQGCIIPGPYFPGFDKVLNIAGVRACVANRGPGVGVGGGGGVEGSADEGISPRVLQDALSRARAADIEVRVLLLTSPHNPTGRLYSPKALLAAIEWARKRGLHVVVDEVYANCVHRPNAMYRSVGSLLMTGGGGVKEGRGPGEGMGLGDDVHVLYGLSKDLGIAGWRVGVLYSENKEVVSMVSKMAHTSQASSDTMDLVGRLFLEPGFLDEFFAQHQEGLRVAYMSLMNQLGRKGIMHLQAEAGLFVMLDLREFLESATKEAEEKLWLQMLEHTKVNLTPGTAFHCVEPGWFRLCFAYQPIGVVSRAVDRIADFLETILQDRGLARKELQTLRQRESVPGFVQQQEQQREERPSCGEASTAATTAAAVFASSAAYLSATIRSLRLPGGRAATTEVKKSSSREEEEEERHRRSAMVESRPLAAAGGGMSRPAQAVMWKPNAGPSSRGAVTGTAAVPPGPVTTGLSGGDPPVEKGADGGGGVMVSAPPEPRNRRPVVDTVPW